MNGKQANDILQSITKDDQREARNILKWLAKNMRGGTWDKLDQPQKLIIMIAFSVVYGWKKGVKATGGTIKNWFIIYRNTATGKVEISERAGKTEWDAIGQFRNEHQPGNYIILQAIEANKPKGKRK